MNNQIDLVSLQVFCCVARLSSFIGAAQELDISAPVVTMRISELERQFGVKLFHRTTRRVRITDQGELLYSWARKLLDVADDMTDAMSSTKSEPSGALRVSTTLRLGRHHVCPILSMLGVQCPKLDIWLEVVGKPLDMIEEGIDIDIRAGEVHEPHLIAHRIVKSRRILCAAPSYLQKRGHPTSVAELAQHNCLLFRERDRAFGSWHLDGPNGQESVKVTGRMGSNHSDMVRTWALNGYGIIMFSDWDIHTDLENGRMVRVLPAYSQPADVYAVTSARLASSAKVRYSIEFLIEQLRDGPFSLQGCEKE